MYVNFVYEFFVVHEQQRVHGACCPRRLVVSAFCCLTHQSFSLRNSRGPELDVLGIVLAVCVVTDTYQYHSLSKRIETYPIVLKESPCLVPHIDQQLL